MNAYYVSVYGERKLLTPCEYDPATKSMLACGLNEDAPKGRLPNKRAIMYQGDLIEDFIVNTAGMAEYRSTPELAAAADRYRTRLEAGLTLPQLEEVIAESNFRIVGGDNDTLLVESEEQPMKWEMGRHLAGELRCYGLDAVYHARNAGPLVKVQKASLTPALQV